MRKLVALLLCIFTIAAQVSALAETQYDTGHFTVDIPDGWIQRGTDTFTYFYGEKYGSTSRGMLGVREVEFKVHSDTVDLDLVYASFADSVVNSKDSLGEVSRSIIEIDDGGKAIVVSYTQELNTGLEPCFALMYYNEYSALNLIYVNSSSNNDFNELISFVESVKYSSVPAVTVHHFGSKHVSVNGWEVIYQYDTPCLLVEYEWYHTEDKPIAFSYSISTEVYQDGVQCMPYLWLDGEENDYLKIQKNTNLTCYEVFILNNATSPVTLYVDSMFDFSDRYDDAVYQFDIAR